MNLQGGENCYLVNRYARVQASIRISIDHPGFHGVSQQAAKGFLLPSAHPS